MFTASATSRRSHRECGGTVANVITAVIFFGLIGMGVWWVIKTTGQAGQQYTEAMIKTKHKATTLNCQMNMQTIFQNVHIYAVSNEHFPESQAELVELFLGMQTRRHCPRLHCEDGGCEHPRGCSQSR